MRFPPRHSARPAGHAWPAAVRAGPRAPERPGSATAAAALAAPTLFALGLLLSPSADAADPPSAALTRCTDIGTPTDRLACYDRLAGRPPSPAEPAAAQPIVGAGVPAPTTALVAKDTPPVDPTPADPKAGSGLLSRFWELDPGDRRGLFNFVGDQPNYVMPVHLTNRVNHAPASPTRAAVPLPDLRRVEAKFQLSLRTKLVEDAPGIGGDVWAAFTQQSFWQVYDSADSRPFRNSDYQPEAIYVRPIGEPLATLLPFGWRWRYGMLALAHQSNGQSDPLSRSWNRAYLGLGADRGDFAVTLRLNKRLFDRPETDDNPDLVRRRGRAELQLLWTHGLDTALVEVRSSLRNTHDGGIRVEATTPIFRDRPNGLRWIVQAFSGYGETLTDYNFRQTSIGAGVSFLQF